MTTRRTNAGDYVKLVAGIDPADSGDATINGAGIDRIGFYSCVLQAASGVAAGGTLTTFDVKLQDSADNSAFADVDGAAITQITADSTSEEVDVNLQGLRQFIRAVAVVDVSAGTIPVAVTIALGGSEVEPV